jgi:hypothetical protein
MVHHPTDHNVLARRCADWLHTGLLLGIALLLSWLMLWSIGHTPAPWWDEGWTMLVARHLIQDGIYGALPINRPQASTMAASLPNGLLVALSFQLFGVGIWQARLPAALLTLTTLGLIYLLTRALYDRATAIASIVLLLLTATHLATNPLYAGRQTLGEPLQLAALLGGYVVLLVTKRRPWMAWLLACLLWGLALLAKAQTLPFWLISLVSVVLIALIQRRWQLALYCTGAIVGGFAMRSLWNMLLLAGMNGRIPAADVIPDIAWLVGFAPVASERIGALLIVLLAGLPTLFGILWSAWRLLRQPTQIDLVQPAELVRVMLLALAASWLFWYLSLALSWPRYFYPVIVIAAPLSAALFMHITNGFHPKRWLDTILIGLKEHAFGRALAALFAACVLLLAVPTTIIQLSGSYQGDQTAALTALIQYLNNNTAADAVIERYESEILFLLERPYHYPPDATNVILLERGITGRTVPLEYNPLIADPDYLVTSYYVAGTGLYEPSIAAGQFRLIKQFEHYNLYQRVR